MPRRKRFWTCTRQKDGIKCNTLVPNAKRSCPKCGKAKPAARTKKHMLSLNNTYEYFIELNGGEHCGICGITRDQTNDPSRKLDRDHGHDVFGSPRGLLCRKCNLKLSHKLPRWWLAAAAEYLGRHEARMAALTEEEDECTAMEPAMCAKHGWGGSDPPPAFRGER